MVGAARQTQDPGVVFQTGPDQVAKQALDKRFPFLVGKKLEKLFGLNQGVNRIVRIGARRLDPVHPSFHKFLHHGLPFRFCQNTRITDHHVKDQVGGGLGRIDHMGALDIALGKSKVRVPQHCGIDIA